MIPVTTPLFLLLTGLGAGVALCQALLPADRTSPGYARTMALVGLGCLLAALAYDAWFRLGPGGRGELDGAIGHLVAAAHSVAAVVLAVYAGRMRSGAPVGGGTDRILAWTAALLSGAAVAVTPLLVLGGESGAPLQVVAAVQGLAGAAVLGTGMSSMLLGHFYLVVPGLSIAPLRRLTALFVAVVAGRLVLDAAAMAISGTLTVWPQPAVADPVGGMLMATLPLLMRILFGLVGALVLGVMTMRTVAIRSTQSATGILYAAVVFILIGEFAAGHLLVAAGVPL